MDRGSKLPSSSVRFGTATKSLVQGAISTVFYVCTSLAHFASSSRDKKCYDNTKFSANVHLFRHKIMQRFARNLI
jgi:hypothetical protein